ncbi:MAG: type II secretion system F family protein [Deltaproteobacteria bacterium]|jgi:type II secretory pathway component PulF|nr:type II secretion system F family protein [Deltaproteobacteria bacterium]
MLKTLLLKSHFNDAVRAKVWRKLATQLRYKIGELQALTMLRDRYAAQKHPLAKVFDQVIDVIHKGGQSLDVAFYPWVPHEEIMLIRGGQKSARLEKALLDCVNLIESRKKIKNSLRSALAGPALLVVFLIVLLLIVALYVVPELAIISDPSTWDGAAAVLYSVSDFVGSYTGLACLIILILAVAIAFVTLPFWTGPLRVKFDNFPPWSIYRLINGSVWLFTVATLLRANVQLNFIFSDMLEQDILRPWLRERVNLIYERYKTEANFGTVLINLNMNFPDRDLAEDLAVYASLPDFHTNIYNIAKEWLDEGIEKVEQQTKVLNNALLIAILVVMCGLAIAIGSMQQQFTGSMGGF